MTIIKKKDEPKSTYIPPQKLLREVYNITPCNRLRSLADEAFIMRITREVPVLRK